MWTQVNHIDGKKTNNQICNLEFVSPKENQQNYMKVLLDIVCHKTNMKSSYYYGKIEKLAVLRESINSA